MKDKEKEKAQFEAAKADRRDPKRLVAVFDDPRPGAVHRFPGSGTAYRRMADGSLRRA